MIFLTLGAERLAALMAADPRGPDLAWLLHGPEAREVEDHSATVERCANGLTALRPKEALGLS